MSADNDKLIARWRDLHFSQDSEGKQAGDALAAALEAAERRLAVLGQERDAIAEALNAVETQLDTLARAGRKLFPPGAKIGDDPSGVLAEFVAALVAVEPPEEQA